jgi:putative tricarboxylic transport membrane protein
MLVTQFSLGFSAALLVISAGYTIMALKVPIGTITAPGPGFMPLILGILAFALTLIYVITSMKAAPLKISWQWPNLKEGRFLPFLLGIVVFAFIFMPLGFEISTLLLGIYLMKVTGVKGWARPVIYSAIVVGLLYLIFKAWLNVPLP